MSPSPPPHTHPLALPPSLSPDDLDSLTELSVVLAKVRAHIQATSGILPGATPGGPSSSGQQLSFKDVPSATYGLLHKVQRARTQVAELPDMRRTQEEQGKEVRELEARIARQRELLGRLREQGVRLEEGEKEAGEKMMEDTV